MHGINTKINKNHCAVVQYTRWKYELVTEWTDGYELHVGITYFSFTFISLW